MYFLSPQDPSHFGREVRRWLMGSRDWYLRPVDQDEFDATGYLYLLPSYRTSTAEEIASAIVNDPALCEALGFLSSPGGQAIEQVVAEQYLPTWQAELLTDALTRAWKIVLNQNRPVWQRVDVLIGVGVLAIVGLIILFSKNSSGAAISRA
jgi:hypothetical protein